MPSLPGLMRTDNLHNPCCYLSQYFVSGEMPVVTLRILLEMVRSSVAAVQYP